jgi:inosine-uridine nucleoside N-ribohydrolase
MLLSILTYVCIRVQIPVYRGAVDPIVETTERAENVHYSDGFGDFHYPDAPNVDEFVKKEHAVNYLTRITSENPGMCCTRRSSDHSYRRAIIRILATRNSFD